MESSVGRDERIAMLDDEALDIAQLSGGKAVVHSESDRPQPEFRFAIFACDVDVRRLGAFGAVEMKAIGPTRRTVGVASACGRDGGSQTSADR